MSKIYKTEHIPKVVENVGQAEVSCIYCWLECKMAHNFGQQFSKFHKKLKILSAI